MDLPLRSTRRADLRQDSGTADDFSAWVGLHSTFGSQQDVPVLIDSKVRAFDGGLMHSERDTPPHEHIHGPKALPEGSKARDKKCLQGFSKS